MEQFWFYIKMGLDHVLDLSAYDHILFLAALAIPFMFKDWKKVLLLATVFTIAHCLSLALSAFDVLTVNVGLIEFLIPVTIALTALYNLWTVKKDDGGLNFKVHMISTTFFGLVHGFGFSNFFKMMMADEENKIAPLFGFATGIELSQVLILIFALLMAFVCRTLIGLKKRYFMLGASIIVLLITIPMLVNTFPW